MKKFFKDWYLDKETSLQKRSDFMLFLSYFLPIVVIWTCCLIFAWSELPPKGDVEWQWNQALGITRLDDMHSVGHTLYMRIFRYLGGLGVYYMAQIILFSATFTSILMFFERRGVSRTILEIFARLLAISPMNIVFMLMGSKDLPYTVAILIITVLSMKIVETKGEKISIWISIPIAVCAIFRHNGIVVTAGVLLFLFITCFKTCFKKIPKVLLISVVSIGLIFGMNFLVFNIMNATPSGWNYLTISIYSKPIMGIIANNGAISEENLAFINESICPIELIKEKYNPYSFQDFLWGGKDTIHSLDILYGNNISENSDKIREMFWELYPENKQIVWNDWIKTRHYIYSFWWSTADSLYETPAVPLKIIKHGTYLLFLVVFLFIAIKRKGFRAILPFTALLFNVLSVISAATPEYRYLWATFICFPVLLLFTFTGDSHEKNT